MTKNILAVKSYVDEPCERCGRKKRISKSWTEKLETISGVSVVEVSQITCTNKACQDIFDKNRAEELLKVNARKLQKEEQDKLRKENIARTIAERKRVKVDLKFSK